MNKKLAYDKRKLAVEAVLLLDEPPAKVADDHGISIKTLRRYIDEFCVLPERPFELYKCPDSHYKAHPKGLNPWDVVDILYKSGDVGMNRIVMDVNWASGPKSRDPITHIKGWRKSLSAPEKLEEQKRVYKEMKDMKTKTEEDSVMLYRGFSHVANFDFSELTPETRVDVKQYNKYPKYHLQLKHVDLTTTQYIRVSQPVEECWEELDAAGLPIVSKAYAVDVIFRDGSVGCRLPVSAVEGYFKKRNISQLKQSDILYIREHLGNMYAPDSYTYVSGDWMPEELQHLDPKTQISIIAYSGAVVTMRLSEVDWKQKDICRNNVLLWKVLDKVPEKKPTEKEDDVAEYVKAPLGFENISIVSGAVVAYSVSDVTHPVLVLREKRPVEYMEICNLMALGNEEGIKDVLRSIFNK